MDAKAYREKKWAALFNFLDVNQDGVLSFDEMMFYPCKLIASGKVEHGTRLALVYTEHWKRVASASGKSRDIMALDKDSYVVGNDHVASTAWYKDEFLPNITDIYFDSIDKTHDGVIDLSEWTKFYENRGIVDKEFHLSTFNKVDEDGDGFISRSEFKHAFERFALSDDPTNDYSFVYDINF